jgi:hypothetical protein
MGGGAWPFLVGGVICLVNSDNERDLNLLTSDYQLWVFESDSKGGWVKPILSSIIFVTLFRLVVDFLEGLLVFNQWKFEAITGL